MEQWYKVGYFGHITHFPDCMQVFNWIAPNKPNLIRVSLAKENLQSMKRHWSSIGVWKIKKLTK